MSQEQTKTERKVADAARKFHGHCIYKVREVTSPIHKDFRGMRMVVAVPNMNGHKAFSDTPAPSFAKSYMLFQSSDYDPTEVDAKVQAHIRWLLKRGFEKVEPAEIYGDRINAQMSKGRINHVEHDNDEE